VVIHDRPLAFHASRAAQIVFVRRGHVVACHAGRPYVADPCTAMVVWPGSRYSVDADADGQLTTVQLAPGRTRPLLGHLRPNVDVQVRLHTRVLLAYAGFASAMRVTADRGPRDAAALRLVGAALRSTWSASARVAARRITTSAIAQLSAAVADIS